jgi:hypothetical protein
VIAARARREDEAARAGERQHAARSFRMWPTPDGMMEGHFKVTPQVGGALQAVIDRGTASGSAMPGRTVRTNRKTATRPMPSPMP